MRIQHASLAVSTCLVLLVTGSAIADDNGLLKGKFRLTLEKSCADVPDGFNVGGSPDFPIWFARGIGNPVTLYFFGVATYDGNGHATISERGTFISAGPYSQGQFVVTAFVEKGDLTYEVNPNGRFTEKGVYTATDGSFRVTGVKHVGQIEAQGSVLIYGAAIPPVVETLEFYSNGTLVGSTQRLCGVTGSAVRIQPERD